MNRLKLTGAYFTPQHVVEALVCWAVREESDRLLDPSCGDGRFISAHRNSVGIEQEPASAQEAINRAPWALVHEGDFFQWADATPERFECCAGNPPFIRYQHFKGDTRRRALNLCARAGATFSGLSSSWAPFLVAAASLLLPGGRMAFVVPAEIGHAPYAAPLLDYLVTNFGIVHVVAVKKKLFPEISEDCWLLFADRFGESTSEIRLTAMDAFEWSARPPRVFQRIPIKEWSTRWNKRLRPYLISGSARDIYSAAVNSDRAVRLSKFADIGIGYVSGDNEFFHLTPSEAVKRKIPKEFLHPSVRTGRSLPGRITSSTVAEWKKADERMLLLRIRKEDELPSQVRDYLDSAPGKLAREAYKCRTREPWYSVPDVRIPDFVLTYMSGKSPSLVKNEAGVTCTNTVHSIRIRDKKASIELFPSWKDHFVQMSCELEGHPLGGGMLKLEVKEAARVAFLKRGVRFLGSEKTEIESALAELRRWRHL